MRRKGVNNDSRDNGSREGPVGSRCSVGVSVSEHLRSSSPRRTHEPGGRVGQKTRREGKGREGGGESLPFPPNICRAVVWPS